MGFTTFGGLNAMFDCAVRIFAFGGLYFINGGKMAVTDASKFSGALKVKLVEFIIDLLSRCKKPATHTLKMG